MIWSRNKAPKTIERLHVTSRIRLINFRVARDVLVYMYVNVGSTCCIVWKASHRFIFERMVHSCCTINCTARDIKETREKGVKFYHIPQTEPKRMLWLNAIRRKDFNPGPETVICSQHFWGGT